MFWETILAQVCCIQDRGYDKLDKDVFFGISPDESLKHHLGVGNGELGFSEKNRYCAMDPPSCVKDASAIRKVRVSLMHVVDNPDSHNLTKSTILINSYTKHTYPKSFRFSWQNRIVHSTHTAFRATPNHERPSVENGLEANGAWFFKRRGAVTYADWSEITWLDEYNQ